MGKKIVVISATYPKGVPFESTFASLCEQQAFPQKLLLVQAQTIIFCAKPCIFQIFVVPLQPILFWRIVRIRVRRHINGLLITVVFLLCSMALWADEKLSAPVHYQSSDSMIMMNIVLLRIGIKVSDTWMNRIY